MKVTGIGIVRRVDDLGRIVLPKELRRTMGIREGTPMEISSSTEGILLTKYCPEINLNILAQQLDEAVEDACIESEKSTIIKRSIQEIQRVLQTVN